MTPELSANRRLSRTGLEEVERERPSVALHVSQADFGTTVGVRAKDHTSLNDVLRIVTVNRRKSFQLALSFQGEPCDRISQFALLRYRLC